MTRRTRAARLGAALLVCLFVVAQMASLAHRATVRHVLCPEHGELLHVRGEGPSAQRSPAVWRSGSAERTIRQALGESLGTSEHDSCTAFELERRPFDTHLARELPALTPPPDLVRPVHEHAQFIAPLPLLRLAPKNSPPMSA
ncbi:MAG: hypothetical protein ACXU88_12340 [Myxococcaceae bacterium]